MQNGISPPSMKVTPWNNDLTTWNLPDGAIARLGRGCVRDIAFSPDGSTLAIGSRTGLWWYELSTLSAIALQETERGLISAVAFSPDRRLFAAGNWDNIVKVWNVQRGIPVARMEMPRKRYDTISQIAFSPDGQRLAASGQVNVINVWNPETGALIVKLTVGNEPKSAPQPAIIPLAFSPDSNLLASTTLENSVSVWHMETGKKVAHFAGHTECVYSISFSPCGRFIASGGKDGKIHVWDVEKEQQERVYTEYAKYRVIPSYSPDGTLLAAGICENTVLILDVSQGEKQDSFEYTGAIRAFRFSDNGEHFAVAGPRDFKVWSAGQTPTLSALHGHIGASFSVVFSPDGKQLASGVESTVRLWDVRSKHSWMTFAGHSGIRSVDFSPCGKMLAFCSHNTTIKVCGVATGTPIAELTEHHTPVYALAFSPTGTQLVSGDTAGKLYVWDVQRLKRLKVLTKHTDCLKSVAFSPDGNLLATASEDNTARLWDITRCKQIASLPLTVPLEANTYKGDPREIQQRLKSLSSVDTPPNSRIEAIAFSPRGDVIAGGLYREIRFWDVPSCDIRMIIPQPQGCHYPFALAFSPCGGYLASGTWWQGTDKVSIRLWEVASGENIATFWGHPTDIQSLAFSPDGELLASGSFDGTILLWDMTPYL